MNPWLDFAVLGCAALAFFFACAIVEKRTSDIVRFLLIGIPAGIALGLLSDVALWGLYSYPLGYEVPYLILNAAVVYGLFVATVLLLQSVSSLSLVLWICVMTAVYETVNHFFPVWTYTITPFSAWIAFVIIGYFATALFIVAVSHFWCKYRFRCVHDVLRSLSCSKH